MSSPPRAPKGADMLRGNVLWLSVASFLNDAASEMIFPLLPLFLVGTLGAGPAFLGLVEGIAESISSFVKLAGGWLSDRVRRRKRFVVGGYALAGLARPLLSLAAVPWHVLAVRLADRIGKGLRSAPRDALLAASVPPGRRGRAFGIHRAADHAGALIGPVLATGILLLAPGDLRLVFALALIPGLLTVGAVAAGVRERVGAGEPEGATGRGDRPVPAPDPTPLPSPLRRFLLVLVVFTLGNGSDAFLLLRAAELGVSAALVPLLWSALHVSKAVWSLVGGHLADRWGGRRAVLVGWAVYGLTYAGFALAGSAWHAWVLFGFYGLFHGLTEAPEKALVASLAPEGRAGAAFGAYHFAVGLAALPASLVFGVVWQAWGAAAAFWMGAGMAGLAAALLVALVPPAHGAGRKA